MFFSSYATPAPIAYSVADDFIGLAFVESGGVHYGYAEVDGPELVGYAYQSVAGEPISAQEVPEPAGITVVAMGLAGLALVRRRDFVSVRGYVRKDGRLRPIAWIADFFGRATVLLGRKRVLF